MRPSIRGHLLARGRICYLRRFGHLQSRNLNQTAHRKDQGTSSMHGSVKTYQVSRPPRLRFAPSPTGQLHLGGLRTALFNHLFARRFGGQWILRIEDTDQTRTQPGAIESLQDSLSWAGLDYDEGHLIGGSKGPYVQSQRLELYRHHAERLISLGRAYRDFRPPEVTKPDGKRAKGKRIVDDYVPPDEDEARGLIREGKAYVVRLKTQPKETRFEDLVFGQINFQPDQSQDPILLKSDGWPTYHLANVVDDHEMEITHVLRGEEWLPSVPKHLDIYAALGFEPPEFCHLPLLMGKNGSKLSKRDGEVHVGAYRELGYEPEALLNFIALMGYNHRVEKSGEEAQKLGEGEALDEVKTMQELIDEFDPLQISPSRSALFLPKLQFLNRRHVATKLSKPEALNRIHQQLLPAFRSIASRVPNDPCSHLVNDERYVKSVIQLVSSRVDTLKDLPAEAWYFFQDPVWELAPRQADPRQSGADTAPAPRKKKDGNKPYKFEEFDKYLSQAQTALKDLQQSKAFDQQSVSSALDAGLLSVPEGDSKGSTDTEDPQQAALLKKAHTKMAKIMRFALCAGQPGPDIASLVVALGPETTLRRLAKVHQLHREAFDFDTAIPHKQSKGQHM